MYPEVRALLRGLEEEVLESYEEHHAADVLDLELAPVDRERSPFMRLLSWLDRWASRPLTTLIVIAADMAWVVLGVVTGFPVFFRLWSRLSRWRSSL